MFTFGNDLIGLIALLLAIWANHGATVVHVKEPLRRVTVVKSIWVDGRSGTEEEAFKIKIRIKSSHYWRSSQAASVVHVIEVVRVEFR